jgi:group I intron endonuclease
MNSGIYKIINIVSGKQYVGSAENLNKRKREHLRTLRANNHHNVHLQRAWNRYGEAAIEFRVVGKCAPERLIELEQEVMDHLKPEYNISPVAGSSLGIVRSEETKRRISRAKKGVPHQNKRTNIQFFSEETRAKMSAASKGNTYSLGKNLGPRSSKTRAKISASKMGHSVSTETRTKISESLKAWWATKKVTGEGD